MDPASALSVGETGGTGLRQPQSTAQEPGRILGLEDVADQNAQQPQYDAKMEQQIAIRQQEQEKTDRLSRRNHQVGDDPNH